MTVLRMVLVSFLLSLGLIIQPAKAELKLPPRNNQAVVDDAHVFSPTGLSALSKQLTQWHNQTHHDLVVFTTNDLQGYPLEDYGYQLGRGWRLGQTGIDDAAILIYAKVGGHGSVRLEVAKGFEPVLTDAMSKQIIHQVASTIKAKGPEAGLQLGANLTTSYIDAHEQDVKKASSPTSSSPVQIISLLVGLCIAGMVVLSWIKNKRKKAAPVSSTPQQSSLYTTNYPRNGYTSSYWPANNYFPNNLGSAAAAAASTIAVSSMDDDTGYSRCSSSSDDSDTDTSSSIASNSDDSAGFSSNNSDDTSFSGGGASEDC
jgi:uncharacterized membrane protein YgcG